MGKIFFTSDTHAWHSNIIRHCNRPFANAGEMTCALPDNINKMVGVHDTLYHLGDFAWRDTKSWTTFRNMIKCEHIHLVAGNHDKQKYKVRHLFSSISDYKEIYINDIPVIMFHYPIATWNKRRYDSIHLFGHCHGTFLDPPKNSIDVGVDCHNFCPISWEEVLDKI